MSKREEFNKLVGGVLKQIVSGEGPMVVEQTHVEGLFVSTIYAEDIQQYETAIVDLNAAGPVERYADLAAAQAGHKNWCEKAKTLTVINVLGYGSIVPEEKRIVIRQHKHNT